MTDEAVSRGIPISDVYPGSPADKAGIQPGMFLHAINEQRPRDFLDYLSLTDSATVRVTFSDRSALEGSCDRAKIRTAAISKREGEPIGLGFDEAVFDGIRTCKNRCVFCFVDQLPKGLRRSLYLKDDDFRLSLLYGNFITLSNLSDAEVDRILAERISPLYVSLHATDPVVREDILRMRPGARRDTLDLLSLFLERGLDVHVQIVLCPSINDADVLDRSLADLSEGGRFESVASVGIVPVGLTGHRSRLAEIRPVSPPEAAALINKVAPMQKLSRRRLGRSHIYLADELYLLAGSPFPAFASYDDFPQLENGIGLCVRFLREVKSRLSRSKRMPVWNEVTLVTGRAAESVTKAAAAEIQRTWGTRVTVLSVENRFFGGNIDVAPLLTAHDLIPALSRITGLAAIPDILFSEYGVLLDGTTFEELRAQVPCEVVLLPSTGKEFIAGLEGLSEVEAA